MSAAARPTRRTRDARPAAGACGGASSGNAFLDRLLHLAPELRERQERLALAPRTSICGTGEPMPHLYFPAGGVLSLLVRTLEGRSAEVGTVGSEGFAPIAALLRVRRSPLVVQQQAPGDLIRLPVAPVARAMHESDRVHALIHCYCAYSLRLAQQAAACNALHGIVPRTARWLLMTADRAASDEFPLTQEMLAEMLGTARQIVNRALQGLQRQQLLAVRRGRIRLLDRRALETQACECYAFMSEHYRELLP